VAKVYPCEAAITLNGESRKAMADQIATVSKLRLQSRQGTLSEADMRAVEVAIAIQLGLPLRKT
jgi:mRNA interferase MazF